MAVSRVTTDPVCNLIGGSGRRQVLAVMEVAPGTADGMARQCAEWVEQGVRGFKAKVGAIPEDDVERLAAIRAAVGPKIMLRADANQGYTPKEAIRLCRMCERLDLGLELLEQPVPKWDLAGMAQVRAAVDVLIEADEAAYTPHDVVQIIRAQAADVINIKIAKAGGLCTDDTNSEARTRGTPLRRPRLVQNSDPCQSWVRNVRWWSSSMPSSVVRSWRSSDTTMRRPVSG